MRQVVSALWVPQMVLSDILGSGCLPVALVLAVSVVQGGRDKY